MSANPTTDSEWRSLQAVGPTTSILIEASAGTGKTYQTEGLVLRLVCGLMEPGENQAPIPIERLVIITFTRAAAAELRDRVRARLVFGRNLLHRKRDGGALTKDESDDEINRYLWEATDTERDTYLEHLQTALANYDLANISTIHSFCQEMLATYGLAAGLDPGGLEQVDDTAILTRYTEDLHAALLTRCPADQLAPLSTNGWNLADAAKTIQRNGAKVSPEELIPNDIGWTNTPTVAEVADKMLAELAKLKTDLDKLADEVNDWFSTEAGQAFQQMLKANLVPGFSHWAKAENPVGSLVQWVRSQKQDVTAKDANFWLKKIIEGKAHPKATEAYKSAVPFFESIYARLESIGAPLLAIALHGATRIVRARQKQHGLQTFDSMVRDLADALVREKDTEAKPLRRALQQRFSVALVDEFQDTDSAQWDILREVFLDGDALGHRLIAVGDPKQSIYRFRGANLGVYEDARSYIVEKGGAIYRLPRNFRSDTGVIQAINALFAQASWSPSASTPKAENSTPQADGSTIHYTDVLPKKDSWKRLKSEQTTIAGDLPFDAPFELRWLGNDTVQETAPAPVQYNEAEAAPEPASPRKSKGKKPNAKKPETKSAAPKPLAKKTLEPLATEAAARRIHALLDGTLKLLTDEDPIGRPLAPSDIAVLTTSHAQCEALMRALARYNIPSIRRDNSSVFSGACATWVHTWLAAVADPRNDGLRRQLALTPLVGWEFTKLDAFAANDNDEWIDFCNQIRDAAEKWPKLGFGGAFQRFLDHNRALPRILQQPDGDQDANDLYSLLDICDAETRSQRLSPAGLARWVSQQQANAQNDSESPFSRTLATDKPSVILSTIHASKGLEYPVVLVPYCWSERVPKDNGGVIRFSQKSRLSADAHPKGHADRKANLKIAIAQAQAEAMRLLYVALTRASRKVILWGAHHNDDSPVERLLKSKDAAKVSDLSNLPGPIRDFAVDEPLLTSPSTAPSNAKNKNKAQEKATHKPLEWTGRLHKTWQNASFSSLSGPLKAHQDNNNADGVEDGDANAPDDPGAVQTGSSAEREDGSFDNTAPTLPPITRPPDHLLRPILWESAPQGTEAGKWIHSILEDVSFLCSEEAYRAKDGRTLAELMNSKAEQERVPKRVSEGDPKAKHCAHRIIDERLPGWLTTPLHGPYLRGIPDDFQLTSIADNDRLDELNFDLRVGAGHGSLTGKSACTTRDQQLRDALEEAANDAGLAPETQHWVRSVLERKTSTNQPAPILTRFEGFLNGKIDLIFRIPKSGRYFVADYKTNALTGTEEVVTRNQSWGPTESGGPIPRLRRWHYTRPQLAVSMAHSAYHLQSLLYTVALHRYLQARLVGYHPDTHLGGHLYLYLRGMEGPDTPIEAGSRLGVWTDRWPASTVVAIADALSGTNGGAK